MAALDRRSAASAPGYSIQSNHHTVFYCRRGMQLSATGSVLFDHGGVAAAVVFGRTSQPCSASPLPDLSARLESCPCFNPFVGTSQPRDNDRYHLIDRRSGWIGSSERRPFIYSHQHRCRNYFAPVASCARSEIGAIDRAGFFRNDRCQFHRMANGKCIHILEDRTSCGAHRTRRVPVVHTKISPLPELRSDRRLLVVLVIAVCDILRQP